jgi:uncharacterized protein (TIGR03083 family)
VRDHRLVIVDRPVDCGEVYAGKRRELVELMRTLSDGELATMVPATPAWSVHDVLSHLVGIAADLNAQRFDVVDPDEWTARQVLERRDRSVDELAEEWEREGPRFEEGLRLFGYGTGSHFVGDLLQHTADVRHALGLGILPDDEALAVGLDFYLVEFDRRLTSSHSGTWVVAVPGEEWTLGAGPLIGSLRATRFDAFRTLGGRRSESQIRAMDWSTEVDGVLEVVSAYPLPEHPIQEG